MALKLYISHKITGKAGAAATKEEMKLNCDKAKVFANFVRKTFPELQLHVPAEYEEWVQTAWFLEYVTVDQILRVDGEIISHYCNGMLVYCPDGYISGGMKYEIDWCLAHNIPYLIVGEISTVEDNTMVKLAIQQFIKQIGD